MNYSDAKEQDLVDEPELVYSNDLTKTYPITKIPGAYVRIFDASSKPGSHLMVDVRAYGLQLAHLETMTSLLDVEALFTGAAEAIRKHRLAKSKEGMSVEAEMLKYFNMDSDVGHAEAELYRALRLSNSCSRMVGEGTSLFVHCKSCDGSCGGDRTASGGKTLPHP